MDETDHALTPRIPDLKVNRKNNEINDLPTPPPRQCWVCEPPVIALKTRGPQISPPRWVSNSLLTTREAPAVYWVLMRLPKHRPMATSLLFSTAGAQGHSDHGRTRPAHGGGLQLVRHACPGAHTAGDHQQAYSAVGTGLRTPDLKQQFAQQGVEVVARKHNEFGPFIFAETARRGSLAKAVGAKLD
ncbi:MAG: hypothetical protein Q7K57_11050 [Burkholderiaceae bacterium]|nr:hypothetical protein [Burkholderiaceae bacterium]